MYNILFTENTHYELEGCVPFGDTTEELSRAMIHMMSALTKPVLDATLFSPDPSPSATINATLGMLKKNV